MAEREVDDVFMSYAHLDNAVPRGSSGDQGWITCLAHNLAVGPKAISRRIFIDHQLQPGSVFSTELVERVRSSRTLVLCLSQNYIDSQWCGIELRHFLQSRGTGLDRPEDVFVVELFPFDSFVDVPAEIGELRKHLLHSKFWHQPADASSPILAGYPTPDDSGEEGRKHYWRKLMELQNGLYTRLQLPHRGGAAGASRTTDSPQQQTPQELGTVLLADVTEDLEYQRAAIRSTLESEGVRVLPKGDYLSCSPQEFETRFAQDLHDSTIFVQLLSATPGRCAAGFDQPWPQLQFGRASKSPVPIMQWCERLPEPASLANPAHASLFETPSLRVTNLSAFGAEVVDRLRAERQRRDAVASEPAAEAATGGRKIVFVDDIGSVPNVNQSVRQIIRDAKYDIRSLPAAMTGKEGVDVKAILRACRGGITIFSDRSKHMTVYNRLLFFLNQMAEGGLPLSRWGVMLHSGTVESEFGIQSDDVVPVDEKALPAFLAGL